MNTFNIAVIPGDGIGPEVVTEAIRVLDTLSDLSHEFRFQYETFEWSCTYYLKHGKMMPQDGLELLKPFDAIFLGAIGFPTVPDHVSLWGLLLPIRREFDQYVNLRPTQLLPGVVGPLKRFQSGDIDFVIVRENTEGEYSNMGGRLRQGHLEEVVVQNSVFTRYGTERIMRYAFDLARTRRHKLVAATKSNGINFSMPFWDEVFHLVGRDYPDVIQELVHIDALAARCITDPDSLDVVVGTNLFGDILSDIGGAIQGGIGMAPAANLNPTKRYPSMFEPVHGSAPQLTGKKVANPIGQILTAKMMVDFLGLPQAGSIISQAVSRTLSSGIKTADLGGMATTSEVTDHIIQFIRQLWPQEMGVRSD